MVRERGMEGEAKDMERGNSVGYRRQEVLCRNELYPMCTQFVTALWTPRNKNS